MNLLQKRNILKETSENYALSSVTLPLIERSTHAHGIYFAEGISTLSVTDGILSRPYGYLMHFFSEEIIYILSLY